MNSAVLSAITVDLFMTVIGAGFTSTPGELRVYPQHAAVFLWTVDVDIEDSNFKRFFYNDVEFYSERNSAFQYGGGYEQRTNVTVDTRELGFTLYQITASDTTGPNYKCSVDDREDFRIEDDDAHIFLYGVPSTPTLSSSPSDAVENMQYTITCTSTSNSSPRSGARPMVYNWTRDSLPPLTDRHITSGEGGSTLVINPVLREDHGITYTCTAQESDSTLSSSDDLVLNVKYPPGKPTLQGPTQPLVEGSSSLTLTCSLIGDSLGNPPAHEYRWWITESSYSKTQSGNTLTVTDVSVNEHDGLWWCEGINTIDRESSGEHTVTVNSPATIYTDPGPSVSLLYNETLSVLCEVRARPAASISWRYEGGDTLPSGVQPQSSTRSDGKYTISYSTLQWRPGATDAEIRGSSGEYTCIGANIFSVETSSRVEIDILSDFRFCSGQAGKVHGGIALNTDFEEHICQEANPFPEITRANWTFAPGSSELKVTLPDDVLISLEHTSIEHKKIVLFKILAMSNIHYGTYKMTSGNGIGRDLEFALELTTEDQPDPPFGLVCTDVTAVSLYLEWRAGYHGGPGQTFLITYTDKDTGGSYTRELGANDVLEGEVLRYKISDSMTILPDRSYRIQVDSRNEIGITFGPATTNTTLATPQFIGESTVEIDGDTATIVWHLTHLESTTHIVVNACVSGDNTCLETNITDPSIQPYLVNSPQSDQLVFDFLLYDGDDFVNTDSIRYDVSAVNQPVTWIVVGVVCGVVVLAVVVFLVVLYQKKRIFRRRNGSPDVDTHNYLHPTSTMNEVQYGNVGMTQLEGDTTPAKEYEDLNEHQIDRRPAVYETVQS